MPRIPTMEEHFRIRPAEAPLLSANVPSGAIPAAAWGQALGASAEVLGRLAAEDQRRADMAAIRERDARLVELQTDHAGRARDWKLGQVEVAADLVGAYQESAKKVVDETPEHLRDEVAARAAMHTETLRRDISSYIISEREKYREMEYAAQKGRAANSAVNVIALGPDHYDHARTLINIQLDEIDAHRPAGPVRDAEKEDFLSAVWASGVERLMNTERVEEARKLYRDVKIFITQADSRARIERGLADMDESDAYYSWVRQARDKYDDVRKKSGMLSAADVVDDWLVAPGTGIPSRYLDRLRAEMRRHDAAEKALEAAAQLQTFENAWELILTGKMDPARYIQTAEFRTLDAQQQGAIAGLVPDPTKVEGDSDEFWDLWQSKSDSEKVQIDPKMLKGKLSEKQYRRVMNESEELRAAEANPQRKTGDTATFRRLLTQSTLVDENGRARDVALVSAVESEFYERVVGLRALKRLTPVTEDELEDIFGRIMEGKISAKKRWYHTSNEYPAAVVGRWMRDPAIAQERRDALKRRRTEPPPDEIREELKEWIVLSSTVPRRKMWSYVVQDGKKVGRIYEPVPVSDEEVDQAWVDLIAEYENDWVAYLPPFYARETVESGGTFPLRIPPEAEIFAEFLSAKGIRPLPDPVPPDEEEGPPGAVPAPTGPSLLPPGF